MSVLIGYLPKKLAYLLIHFTSWITVAAIGVHDLAGVCEMGKKHLTGCPSLIGSYSNIAS